MAIDIPDRLPWRVTTYLPNERETQVLGGNQAHASAGINLFQTLRTHAARLGAVWLVRFETELMYPRIDGTTGVFYPDILLAPEVVIDNEKPYEVRLVGRPPALVVEIVSKKTARRDAGPKLQAYAEMGVEEYLTFDPRRGKRLALHGYRLAGPGSYREIPLSPEGGLWLDTVGLRVHAEAPTKPLRGPLLRLTTRDGERLLHSDEEAAERGAERRAREVAERARDASERAWQAAQTEIARLRALLGESAPES
jgi:hypothetical protein